MLTIAAGFDDEHGRRDGHGPVNDDVDAPDKAATVSATAANSQGVTNPDPVTLTITDDDAEPTVTLHLDPSSISEVNGVSAVTASLDRPSSAATTVTVAVAPVPPTAASDYRLGSNRVLTIAAGATTSTGDVTVHGGEQPPWTRRTRRRRCRPRRRTATGVTAPAPVTLTLRDNDAPPTVTLHLSADSISEAGGTSTVTARLSHPSSAATTVTVSAAPVSPAVAGDYTLSGTVLTIAAGATTSTGRVTITGEDNDVGRGRQDGDGVGCGDERAGYRGPAGRDAGDQERRRAGPVDRRRERGRGRYGQCDSAVHGDAESGGSGAR